MTRPPAEEQLAEALHEAIAQVLSRPAFAQFNGHRSLTLVLAVAANCVRACGLDPIPMMVALMVSMSASEDRVTELLKKSYRADRQRLD